MSDLVPWDPHSDPRMFARVGQLRGGGARCEQVHDSFAWIVRLDDRETVVSYELLAGDHDFTEAILKNLVRRKPRIPPEGIRGRPGLYWAHGLG